MLRLRRDPLALHLDAPSCGLRNWGFALEVDGGRVPLKARRIARGGGTVELTLVATRPALQWAIQVETLAPEGRLVVRSQITNRSRRPVRLGKAWLLETTEPVRLGGADADLVCLPLPGHIYPRPVYRVADPKCPRSSKIKLQLYDRTSGSALQVGFLTFQRANTEVEHDAGADGRLSGLRAGCDFAGWELGPGASTATEVFTLAVGSDPYAQLERWADLAAGLCSPRRWEAAPIGWVGWSWVDGFTVERYEGVILRNCRAIRRRLAGFGVNYVWVSLGNLATAPGDWLNWNRELFPDEPEVFAARLRELGFTWGLWCGPFWVCSSLEGKVRELGDALLCQADGSPLVVRPEWQFGPAGKLPRKDRPRMYALDPSHPKALALVREAFETYRRWGVRYYMLDFLHAGAGNIGEFAYALHHDRSLVAGPEVYHRFLRTIREAAGDDTYFLSSSGPSVHNAGAVDAIRTGNDFGEGRPLYPDSYFYPATYVINSGEFWTGPQYALRNQASAWYTHRRLYLNDSGNVLTVDKPLPLSDAQVHATIHALSGGPSMIGDDVDRLDEERLALIKKTLPRPRQVASPVDLFEAVHPDCPKVFHRRIEKPWGRFDVVAVYNFGPGLLTQAVELARLRLDPSAAYLVWEFWDERYLGRICGSLTARVPPHSVRVYRLAADEARPVVLGTDLHILMGEMEIAEVSWDAASRTLTGRALRPAGERGSVFLHAPASLRVASPQGVWISKDARDSSLVLRCALDFPQGEAAWSVRFAPLAEVPDMSTLDLT
jgi:hypothetical protein